MAKKESVLQKKAAQIRTLKESIDRFEKVEESLSNDVLLLEQELIEAQANLRDTKLFLNAQRAKLYADADDMQILISKAVHGHKNGVFDGGKIPRGN